MFAEKYFDKPLNEIEFADLQTYFGSIDVNEERNDLEFKSSGTTKDEISQYVAAFANSEGGLIIWGTPKEIKGENKFEKEFDVVRDKSNKSDSYVSSFLDKIVPRLAGLESHAIQHKDGFIYLFEIAKSKYPPHQHDGTYFIRIDSQKHKAPHYLVESMMKQIRTSEIEGTVKIMFNDILIDGDYFIIPAVLCLSNLTPLHHAFNVKYEVITDNARVCSEIDALSKKNLKVETSFRGELENLKFADPFPKRFFIFLNALMPSVDFVILLRFSSDNSPVKNSSYHYLFSHSQKQNLLANLLAIKENEYYHDSMNIITTDAAISKLYEYQNKEFPIFFDQKSIYW